MPTSPSSSAQQARQALADRLRELRVDASLTAVALAAAAGWHRTKVSKIEHGSRPPSAGDIDTWCRVCRAEDQAADLVATLRTVEGAYVEWRRLQRSGLRRLQESRIPLYERTRRFRIYEPGVVPGLLQTPSYVAAVLSKVAAFRATPTTDLEQAVAARVVRQKVLCEGGRTFAFVLEESALWARLGGRATMAGQLAHLLEVMAWPRVSLGVIPAAADRNLWPVEGFWMFDDDRVAVETVSAWITVTQSAETALYNAAFGELAGLAAYGDEARAIVTGLLRHLT